jgi:hypothetical protein
MARRFVYARKGSGRFYWSALDDGRTIDGLDFANAESEPDELLDIAKMGDLFAMLGANSVETWMLNGDPDLPWTRVSQRTFGRGIFNPGAKAEIPDANTVYFISSDGMVCKMAGDAPQRVSDSRSRRTSSSPPTQRLWLPVRGQALCRFAAGGRSHLRSGSCQWRHAEPVQHAGAGTGRRCAR